MPRFAATLVVSLLGLAACSNKVDTQVDQNLLDRIEAVEDCMPGLFGHVKALLDLSDTWRQLGDDDADPPGVTVERDTPSTGRLRATYVYDNGSGVSGTLVMDISFFDENGAEITSINFDSPVVATTLSQHLDNAAGQMRPPASTAEPFMSGQWTLTGSGTVTGAGSIAGVIGGALNQNELEELITTTGIGTKVPSGTRSDFVQDPDCRLDFGTESLVTDEEVGQEFPRGVVSVQLTRNATGGEPANVLTGSITFDKTAVATIAIDDVGSFGLNLNTREVTAQ